MTKNVPAFMVPINPWSMVLMGQRRRRLTGIEPAIGCNAGPTLNRLVGRPTYFVRGTP